jgi:hypothetical protein
MRRTCFSIAPGFDNLKRTVFLEHGGSLLRMLQVLLAIGGRHRGHESIDIVHAKSPLLRSGKVRPLTIRRMRPAVIDMDL